MTSSVLRPFLFLGLATALAGCPFVGERSYNDNVRDFDGDGAIAERFGGPDCADDDPAITNCDEDGDGENSIAAGGTDCDDTSADVGSGALEICNGIDDDCDGIIDDLDSDLVPESRTTWYRDADGDGTGDPDETQDACEVPAGFIAIAGDCDDSRADVNPGANEFCDLVDHNCDGDLVFNAVDMLTYYVDADGDGFGRDELSSDQGCPGDAPEGTAATNDDCDDGDANVYPLAPDTWYDGVDSDCQGDNDYDQDGDGALYPDEDCDDQDATRGPSAGELCDGVDNDCDGLTDEVEDVAPFDLTFYYVDVDGDGAGGGQAIGSCTPTIPSGHVSDGGDCDDTNPAVNPGGTEVCDGADNDCNGAVDDNAANRTTYYVDGDGDGFGDVEVLGCTLGDGQSRFDGDCNDGDATVFPGAFEICGDAAIQDCDLTAPAFDCDGDGIDGAYAGNGNAGTDCDDTLAATYPNAPEICDGQDNDCDGGIDNPPTEPVENLVYYLDIDGDGYGAGTRQFPATCGEAVGMVTNQDDCNDLDANVHPDAGELCDGIDNNCDTFIDQGLISEPLAFYLDLDGDGAGDPDASYAQSCSAPQDGRDWVAAGTDCNDNDPDIVPGADEICDGIDNDCDALVDDQDSDTIGATWYSDGDSDGFGAGAPTSACSQPQGFVGNVLDCDDSRNDINPGIPEECDGYDNDCDGFIDGADPDVVGNTDWFPDADADGYGEAGATAVEGCVQPVGHVSNDLDCDDTAAAVSPAGVELCDGIDNDCDQLTDDADTTVVGGQLWYNDGDQDGVGAGTAFFACSQPVDGQNVPTAVGITGDCDDADSSTYPSAVEVCDGKDNDCDNVDDQTETIPPVGSVDAWTDGDSDGYGTGARMQVCLIGARAILTTGLADVDGDCDDARAEVNPGRTVEQCASNGTGEDLDCDGLFGPDDPDYDGTNGFIFGQDVDGDGYGSSIYTIDSCSVTPPPGYQISTNDCDDLDPARFPGMAWYADADVDGFGDPNVSQTSADCLQPLAGYVVNADDCNDGNATISPNGIELCDFIDNDCDGLIDDQDDVVGGEGSQFFVDGDGDNFGDPNTVVTRCFDNNPPQTGGPWVTQGFDCDDADPTRNPDAQETCNDSVDSDCNGDENTAFDPQTPIAGGTDYYLDSDGDTYYADSPVSQCTAPTEPFQLIPGTDCNDEQAEIYFGATIAVGPSSNQTDLQNALYSGLCDDTTLQLESGYTFFGGLQLNYLTNLTIRGAGPGNSTIDGAGAGQAALSAFGSNVTIEDLTVTNNAGMGIYVDSGSNVTLRNLEVNGTSSFGSGSGIYLYEVAATIEDVVVRDAQAQGSGACLYLSGHTNGSNVSATRLHCDNAQGQNLGGAIYHTVGGSFTGDEVRVTNSFAPSGEPSWYVEQGAVLHATDLTYHANGGPILVDSGASHSFTRVWAADNAWGVIEATGFTTVTVDNLVSVRNGTANRASLASYGSADVSVDQATFIGDWEGLLVDGGCTGTLSNAIFHDIQGQPAVEFDPGSLVLTNAVSSGNDLAGTVQNQTGTTEAQVMTFERYHPTLLGDVVDAAPTGGWDGALGGHHGAMVGWWDYSINVDGDGMPDAWERWWLGGDALPGDNPDPDSWTNLEEYTGSQNLAGSGGTHPMNGDTDGDGVPDDGDLDPLDANVQ